MVNTLDRWYTGIQNRVPLLVKLRFYTLLRVILRLAANLLVPIYFKLSSSNQHAEQTLPGEKRIIVSLTTFPARIRRIWLVIECMLRQTKRPDKIILWLSVKQFPGKENDLPNNLLRYRSDIFEIRFVDEDLRSHKKYYYAFQEFPEDCIVTIDDDLLYVSSLIADLWILHQNYPGCICCHRASVVDKESGTILPYKLWKKHKQAATPTRRLFQTSGGGTLYTASMLHPEVLNKQVFQDLCFQADDIWLNVMAQMQGTRTTKSFYYSEYLPIWNLNSVKLSRYNVAEGGNDKQLNDLIVYYRLKESDMFEDQK